MICRTKGISLTKKAATSIQKALARGGHPLGMLRICLRGGGCAGVQYRFIPEKKYRRDDVVFSSGGISLLVDCISYLYLRGSVVDCCTKSEKLSLAVVNPNVISTCSCGTSFSFYGLSNPVSGTTLCR